MKRNSLLIIVMSIVLFCSCGVIEKSSRHGLNSGFYSLKSDTIKTETVYLDVADNKIAAFSKSKAKPDNQEIFGISLDPCNPPCPGKIKFSKQSLDIDITTILFKFRPGINGLPAQLNTDFNVALYGGWRHDHYQISSKTDPLHECRIDMTNRGYDFGIFVGPGTTFVSPFSTQNKMNSEYNGMILQYGIAGFIESSVASFGIAAGFDYLFSPDRKIWIYNNKPWIGFIVGIAMN